MENGLSASPVDFLFLSFSFGPSNPTSIKRCGRVRPIGIYKPSTATQQRRWRQESRCLIDHQYNDLLHAYSIIVPDDWIRSSWKNQSGTLGYDANTNDIIADVNHGA